MNKARKLLERALEELIEQDLDLRSEFYTGGEWEGPKVIEEIRAYLAEPKVPFVRLTEEEVNSLTYAPLEPYELICAVENRLVEKNK